MNSFSASTARSRVLTVDFLAAGPVLIPEKARSMDSQKPMAPFRPRMCSAPVTWCRCSGHLLNMPGSSGVAMNRSMLSLTDFRA